MGRIRPYYQLFERHSQLGSAPKHSLVINLGVLGTRAVDTAHVTMKGFLEFTSGARQRLQQQHANHVTVVAATIANIVDPYDF